MKRIALLALLALASCGDPTDPVIVTESPIIVNYPAGSVCQWPVSAMSPCGPYPNRLGRCYTTYGDQAVGCKWSITGPVSYYVTCVVNCNLYR